MANNAELRTMVDDINKDLIGTMNSLSFLAASTAQAIAKMQDLKTLLREYDTNGSKP